MSKNLKRGLLAAALVVAVGLLGTVVFLLLARTFARPWRTLLLPSDGKRWVNAGALAFSPDGELVAAALSGGGGKASLEVWSLRGERLSSNEFTGDSGTDNAFGVAFAPRGDLVAVVGKAGVSLFPARLPGGPRVLEGDFQCLATPSAGGKDLLAAAASIGSGSRVTLFSLPDGKIERTLEWEGKKASSLAFDARGEVLYAESRGDALRAWDVTRGSLRNELEFSPAPGSGEMPFAVSDRFLAHLSGPEVVLFGTQDLSLVKMVEAHRGAPVTATAFSPDGSRLVTTDGWSVRLWSVPGLELLSSNDGRKPGDEDALFGAVAYSPRGDLVAAALHDGSVVLYWPPP
jgi:WD40 repeat protein